MQMDFIDTDNSYSKHLNHRQGAASTETLVPKKLETSLSVLAAPCLKPQPSRRPSLSIQTKVGQSCEIRKGLGVRCGDLHTQKYARVFFTD